MANNTLTILQLISFGVYYLAVGVLAVLSLFGIFLLAAHGRSRVLSLIVSFVYIMFFLTMLGASEAALHRIF